MLTLSNTDDIIMERVRQSDALGEVSERFMVPVVKTGEGQTSVGSNPTFSAVSTGILIEYRLLVSLFGEVPKRLKGLPWKGSRSLIAARGFKSLLLRLVFPKENWLTE